MQKGVIFLVFAFTFIVKGSLAEQNATNTEIAITLFATDLSNCDDLSACDTVVNIKCASISSDWKGCGYTQEMKDDNYPLWPERFTFQYVQSERQRWQFNLVDKDLIIDDPIGSVTVNVEDFIAATEVSTVMKFGLNGRGSFYIHKRIISN